MVEVCGRRVEILAERTEFSQTFVNPDGTLTLDQTLQPTRVRKGSSWAPVDTVLKSTAAGVVPRASVLPMVFSPGGQGPMARLINGSRELSMSWTHGALPVPELDGDTAIYRNVLPDVDLKVTASAMGFSEVLVVRSRAAAADPRLASIRFGLATTGVAVASNGAGGLTARDEAGKEVFASPAPLMWDSSAATDPVDPDGAARVGGGEEGKPTAPGADVPEGARQAVIPVRVDGDGLTLTPDQTWLRSPAATFPVFIDPFWSGKIANNEWTTVWSKFPTSSFWRKSTALLNGSTKGSMGAGRTEDCDTCSDYIIRSLFRMDTAGVRGTQILGATFSVRQNWSWTCGPTSNAKVWLTGAISSDTTWNHQPWWDGNYSAQAVGNRKNGAVHGCLGAGTIFFNVTSIVQRAVASNWNGVTMGLRAVDEGTKNHWKRFVHTSPAFSIHFNRPPSAPSDRLSDGKPCATGTARPYVWTTTPILAAKHSDPDTDQQSLTTSFHWWPAGGVRSDTSDYVSQAAGNPSPVSKAVPAGELVDGGTYVWQSRTWDGILIGPWSGTCEFTVDATPPPTPGTVASTTYPTAGANGGVNVPGVFTIAAPALRPHEVKAYVWKLDSTAPEGGTEVPARTTDFGASVTIRPKHDGTTTLRVWAKDRADRLSTTPKVYTFTVATGSGPAAQWGFDAACSGADDAVHGNTLTITGTTCTPGRAGEGSALAMNGDDALTPGPVTFPHPTTGSPVALRTDSDFTVAAWVRLESQGTYRIAVAANGTRTSSFMLGYNYLVNKWMFRMYQTDTDAPAFVETLSNTTVTLGRWTHLAGVYDASTKQLTLHVNGVAQAAPVTLSTGGFNASGSVFVGQRLLAGATGSRWVGALDDVRLYPYNVLAADIGELAMPLPATIAFPSGASVTAGGQLSVTFDARGDTNITAFKYSVDNTSLNQQVTVSPAGGSEVVTINVGTVAGKHVINVVTADAGGRSSDMRTDEFEVTAAASISGVVMDGTLFSPAVGAVVTLTPGGLTMTTAADGGYTFAGFAPGTYTLAATLGGRCGLSGSIVVDILGPGAAADLTLFPYTDDLGYTCEEAVAAFVPANGTVLGLTGDDAVATVGLPFAFPFYGHAYRQAWVDTNGLVSFTDPGGSHPNTGGAGIPTVASPNVVIAPFWDDLVVDAAASVRTQTTGTGPSARFVIEWRNVHRKASTSQRLSFEIILAPDGTVTTNYADLDNALEQGAAALVGIEGTAGEDGLRYSQAEAVLQSGRSIVFDNPADGSPIEVYDLSGTLKDTAGVAVVGATVRLDPSGLSTTSGAGGAWSFTAVVADSYAVSASSGGRCAVRASQQVELTAHFVVNLQYSPDFGEMGYACGIGTSGFVAAATALPLSGGSFVEQALPFPFVYAGRSYTSAWVTTKGLLTFAGNPGFDVSDNVELPSPGAPNATVAALWDDLVVDASSSVRTQAFGTAPNRSVAFEWRNVYIYPATSARVTFEIVLHEDGRIVLHYQDLDSAVERGSGATVGLENARGTLATPFSFNEDALTANSSITYTPAAPSTVTGSVSTAVTAQSVSNATVTLTLIGTSTVRTTTTAGDGSYQFTGVPVGEYIVDASTVDGRCAGQSAREPVNVRGGVSDVDLSVMVDGDELGYTCAEGPQAFIPAGNVLDLDGDDRTLQVSPPFPIKLYGQTYNQAWVDTNGVVAFREPAESGWDVSPIPSLPGPFRHDAAVYPFWYDWSVDGAASVRQQTLGTAPNRRWVVEWRNVHAITDVNTRVTFEAVFDEATGDVTFAYADIDPASAIERGAGATIGIEDASGTVGFQYSYGVAVLASGQGARFHRDPPAPGGVTGTLTCVGTPVSGASVAVAGLTATSAANGGYTITGVPAGAQVVVATVAGGTCSGSAAVQVTVGAGAPGSLDIPLAPTPAGAGYDLAVQPTTFVPAEDTVLAALANSDDKVTQIVLPFPVNLYGQSYTGAWVDTNGIVSFVDPGGSAALPLPIPSAANPGEPNAALYPFWHDWVLDGSSSVRTATTGTAPNRTFIIEWRDVQSFDDPTVRVSFEVMLSETGGFTFSYDIEDTFLELGGEATVGIENATGSTALQYLHRHPALRPGTGIHFTPTAP